MDSEKEQADKEVSIALDNIKKFCLKYHITLGVAESVSSGYLQTLFSSEAEAGLFFQGGITTYNCLQKNLHLGIPREVCDPCNGVSSEVAKRMALGISGLFKCKLSLSLTGYASPLPELGIFELFAYGAIAFDGETIYCEKIISNKKQPEAIKKDYAEILVRNCAGKLEQVTQNLIP